MSTPDQGIVSAVRSAQAALEMSRLPITDAESYKRAAENVAHIKGYQHELDQHRRALTRPLDESKAGIMALFKPFATRLEEAEATIKKGMADWHAAEQRARAEEARIAREQAAAEQARLAAEAREAERAGDIDTAIDLTFEAEMAAIPMPVAAPMQVAGISHRVVWHAEVTDIWTFVQWCAQDANRVTEYLTPNMAALNALARAAQAQFEMPPGVVAVSENVVAAGRR